VREREKERENGILYLIVLKFKDTKKIIYENGHIGGKTGKLNYKNHNNCNSLE